MKSNTTNRPFITVKQPTRDPETIRAESLWFSQASHVRRYGPPRGYKAYRKWLNAQPKMGLTGFEDSKEAVNG